MSALITHRMVSLAKLAIAPSATEGEKLNAALALAKLVAANSAEAVPDEEPIAAGPGANISDKVLLDTVTETIARARRDPEFLAHFAVRMAMGGLKT